MNKFKTFAQFCTSSKNNIYIYCFSDMVKMCVFNIFRVSRWRWQGFLVKLKLGESVTYYRCQLKPCRLLSHTESQWAPYTSLSPDRKSFSFAHFLAQTPWKAKIDLSISRKPHTIGSTAPCLWKVPLNPGKVHCREVEDSAERQNFYCPFWNR